MSHRQHGHLGSPFRMCCWSVHDCAEDAVLYQGLTICRCCNNQLWCIACRSWFHGDFRAYPRWPLREMGRCREYEGNLDTNLHISLCHAEESQSTESALLEPRSHLLKCRSTLSSLFFQRNAKTAKPSLVRTMLQSVSSLIKKQASSRLFWMRSFLVAVVLLRFISSPDGRGDPGENDLGAL